MPLRTTSSTVLPPERGGLAINDLIERLRQKDPLVAEAVGKVSNEVNAIAAALKTGAPSLEEITVTDPTGELVLWAGTQVLGGELYSGLATRDIYIGSPFPDLATVHADETGVYIGENGAVSVLDPYSAEAAWLGTRWDTLAITGAANSGTGEIRLTVTGHPFVTGDAAVVEAVGGVPYATGTWTVTKVDANRIDLQGSGFAGTYTSGGTVWRLGRVTGAVDNGAGLIRLTVAGHGYKLGDRVHVESVGGVPNAAGEWVVTPITADTFDLQASTFAGTFTTGGWCVRYFAGGHFERLSVGADKTTPVLYANDAGVFIGKNGVVQVLDPYDAEAAWLGTQSDAPKVVTGAADNGAGLIRITIVGHGYETGDRVAVAAVGGVPNATGQWTVTWVSANTFDLQGSTFAGVFTTGGTATRYFAGVLAQQFAIGTSFPNYKLRAFADGSLRIRDALITLAGTGATVTLDPTLGEIIVDSGEPNRLTTTINVSGIYIDGTGAFAGQAFFNSQNFKTGNAVNDQIFFGPAYGMGVQIYSSGATGAGLHPFNVARYMGTDTSGAVIQLYTKRGTRAVPTEVQLNDRLGGFDVVNLASVVAVAAENHNSGVSTGTDLVFEVTPLASVTKAEVARFTSDGLRVGPSTLPAPPAGTILHLGGADAANPSTVFDAIGGVPAEHFRRANGTTGALSAVAADERIGQIDAIGYGATGYSSNWRAALRFYAAETWTDAAQGTYVIVNATPTGSTTAAEVARFGGNYIAFTMGTEQLRLDSTGIGFFAGAPAAQQTLAAYVPDAENLPYSGLASGIGGTPYAGWADINSLRVAYENLRAAVEDLRTKLTATTLVT